jgi:hypothetical protein
MKLYFSGLASTTEAAWLRAAAVDHVLADPKDFDNTRGLTHIALDSGAYRAFKSGQPLDIEAYQRLALFVGGALDFHVQPDVIGDPQASHQHWLTYRQPGMIPVWPWGSDEGLLRDYLDQSEIVGIGGLVPLMRAQDMPMFRALKKLAEKHPGRFHVFGANWCKVINELLPLFHSIDTSKWLDACRYGSVLFIHTRTGKLHNAPASRLGLSHLSRAERAILSATNMNDYCNRRQP